VVRLGQNFLADPNLLDAIVRDAELEPGAVVLEVGAGEGVLTRRLAAVAGHVHTVELDRGLEKALAPLAARPEVELHWGDAMKLDLAGFDPKPTAVVANLPYAIATPLILVLVLGAVWSGVWYYAAGAAEARINAWQAQQANAGRVFSCGTQTVGGFPFRIEVRCVGASAELKDAQGRTVYDWSIAPPVRDLQAHGRVTFDSAEMDVPRGGRNLSLSFGPIS